METFNPIGTEGLRARVDNNGGYTQATLQCQKILDKRDGRSPGQVDERHA